MNSFIGLARESARELPELDRILRRVQHELFNLGSILATLPEDVHPKQARITAAESEQLEREIDRMNEGLPPLRSFVLPGGSRLNAELHVCRTVCRRAERICVALAATAEVDAADFEISEPAQRRAVRLEPLGQPPARARRKRCGSRTRRRRKRYHREKRSMQNQKQSRPLAFGLTLLSALGRLIPHAPNVTPLGGSCLFAGSRIAGFWAYLLPLAVMIATDPIVGHAGGASGGYTWGSPVIYGCFHDQRVDRAPHASQRDADARGRARRFSAACSFSC